MKAAQLPFVSSWLAALSGATGPMTRNVVERGRTIVPTNYSVVPDFFIQDSPDFNATGYDLLQDDFGLLDKSAHRWDNFRAAVARLNDEETDKHTVYKVVYLARHGQGWHNRAETKYGTPAWNEYWSRVEGDDEMTWGPDPELTPLGVEQALAVNAAWKQQLAAGVPLPTSLYSSPLSRSAATLNLTWSDILIEPHPDSETKAVVPLIKERLRETIGLHTCDKRSDRSVIARSFPSFGFEPAFSEHDQLWSPDWQESSQQQALRTQQVLNEIFATDPSTFISITAHGGVIQSFFRVVGHHVHSVAPGGFVPVVVKAVDYRNAKNELLAGGQSRSADPLPTAPPPRRASEL